MHDNYVPDDLIDVHFVENEEAFEREFDDEILDQLAETEQEFIHQQDHQSLTGSNFQDSPGSQSSRVWSYL